MYQADFSKATVLALFLLPSNLLQLRDKIFNLQPGTRVVLNTFGIQDWTPDEQVTVENCTQLVHGHAQHRPRQDRRHVASCRRAS